MGTNTSGNKLQAVKGQAVQKGMAGGGLVLGSKWGPNAQNHFRVHIRAFLLPK